MLRSLCFALHMNRYHPLFFVHQWRNLRQFQQIPAFSEGFCRSCYDHCDIRGKIAPVLGPYGLCKGYLCAKLLPDDLPEPLSLLLCALIFDVQNCLQLLTCKGIKGRRWPRWQKPRRTKVHQIRLICDATAGSRLPSVVGNLEMLIGCLKGHKRSHQ